MDEQLEHWNTRYAEGQTPWDSGLPSTEMQRVLDEYAITPRPLLELGCGTGTNAIYLAQRGYTVTALDLSPLAIERAEARAEEAGVQVEFYVADALVWSPPRRFPLVFDRGVYHVLRTVDLPRFQNLLAHACEPGGYYLTLAGNPNDPTPAEQGPPKVPANEMLAELGGLFELVQLREFYFEGAALANHSGRHLAWSALWRRRR